MQKVAAAGQAGGAGAAERQRRGRELGARPRPAPSSKPGIRARPAAMPWRTCCSATTIRPAGCP